MEKTSKYAGAEWLRDNFKYNNHAGGNGNISPLGVEVAELLGYLFHGLYHLDNGEIHKTDWSNRSYIEVRLKFKSLATFDFSELTRLVLLAHRMAIRVEISPMSHTSLRLLFHKRQRSGDIGHRHPTIREAIEDFEKYCYIPEVTETEITDERDR